MKTKIVQSILYFYLIRIFHAIQLCVCVCGKTQKRPALCVIEGLAQIVFGKLPEARFELTNFGIVDAILLYYTQGGTSWQCNIGGGAELLGGANTLFPKKRYML